MLTKLDMAVIITAHNHSINRDDMHTVSNRKQLWQEVAKLQRLSKYELSQVYRPIRNKIRGY